MERVKCPRCFFVNPAGRDACLKCRTALPRIRIEAQAPAAQVPGMADIQFKRGQVIAERYTILNLVGRGGMGCIYKAHDNTLGEEVALKTLLPQFVQDKMVVERFFQEARIARRLAHPNIVRVHDIQIAGNIIYISMELLKGKSLRDILQNLAPGQRMDLRETLRVMMDLSSALTYAHQYTVHRDIKPENVMVLDGGTIKLMDFGISKLMDTKRVTGASVVMGTPFYMAPEQLRNSRDVDARADIFSMGVMLYEIVTGNMPTGVPKLASEMIKELPPALDTIIGKCVEPDRDKRYQNAEELRGALHQVILGIDAGLTLEQQARYAARRPMPWRQLAGAASIAGLLGLAGYGFGIAEAQRKELLAKSAPAPAIAAAPRGATFAAYAALLPPLFEAARARASVQQSTGDRVDTADTLWKQAEAAGDTPDGVSAARVAAQCLASMWIGGEQLGMRYIPPGTIDAGGGSAPVPPFFIDAKEVTVGDFAAFCSETEKGWRMPESLRGYEESHRDYPVSFVSYYDAQAYAAAHNKRLPSDAEWARAAYGDAAGNSAYPWGGDWEEGAANTQSGSDNPMAAPVAAHEKDKTPFGCFDMAGNVSEWTRSPAPGAALEDGKPTFGTAMLVRGGSFRTRDVKLHDSASEPYESRGNDDLGFRCVMEIPSEPGAIRRLTGLPG